MATLITGASGYVGSHLLSAMTEAERSECLTPSHRELDLTDYQCVRGYFARHKIDCVIHLAACLDSGAPAELFSGNLEGVLHLLSACTEFGVSYLLYISGNNVYGSDDQKKFCEDDRCNPAVGNRYGLSKYCGELMTADYLKSSGIRYGILRIAVIYGPSQKTGALMKAIVNNIKNGQPQKLYGVGDRTRDYIYIDDVARGILFAARRQLEGVYNLSTGVGTRVAELIRLAEQISPCKEPTVLVPVEREDHSCVVLNNDKLRAAGFTPEVSVAEGLRRMAEHGGK